MYKYGLKASVALAAVVAAPSAFAQEDWFVRDKYEAVAERAQPEYDPNPLRLGTFLADASLGLGATSNSNVFATETDEESDVFFVINPNANLRSDWSVHEVGLSADVLAREYNDISSESSTDYIVRANGRFDVRQGAYVGGSVFTARNFEERNSVEAIPAAAEPTEYNRVGGDITGSYTNGRLRFDGDVSIIEFDFEDTALTAGGFLDQDFRDRTETGLRGRVSYAMSRDWALFVQGEYVERDHDDPTIGAPNRDSDNYTFQVGVDFELEQLLRGDIAVGVLETKFDDDVTFEDVDGFSIDGRLQWFVSRLATVTGTVNRDVEASGIFEAAGRETLAVGGRVDYELFRNLLLNAKADVINYDFTNLDREDDRFEVGFGALYKLNPHLQITGDYSFAEQESDGTAAFIDFDEHRVTLAIRLFP